MKRKWNWIDTLIVAFVILAAALFVNRGKLSGGDASAGSNTENIIIRVEAEELTIDMIDELEVGDQFYAQYNLQNAYITDFEVSPKQEIAVGKDGKIIAYDNYEELTLIMEIEAEVVTSGPYMELGGQEIKAGLPIIVKTTDIEFPAKVMNVEVK